jgi:hypothetical protein
VKLDGWHSSFLSKGGRLILLNSVVSSIPVFYFSIFKAPNSIWKRLDVLRKRFFWKGAKHEGRFLQPLKWEQICLPKDRRGLGIKSLKHFNDALLLKWVVKLLQGDLKPCTIVIRDSYGASNSVLSRLQPSRPSPFWKSVIRALADHFHLLQPALGDGRTFSF